MEEKPYTSILMLRTQELLSRSIHAANQLSIHGAVSNWCEEFGRTPCEKEDTSDKCATKENEEILKMVNPQEVNSLVRDLQEMGRLHPGTDCEKVFRALNHCPRPINLREFAKTHRSSTGYRLVCVTRPFLT